MEYRRLGKTNEEVSVLGFGAMRLPIIDGDSTNIDEAEAIRMIRYAIDNGVNYVDTAFPYHGNDMSKPGMSEPLVGKALLDGYREKVKLATKLPIWIVKSREHMDEILDSQLERLQTDSIDFYLVHSVNRKAWPELVKLGLFDFLEKAKEAGKIKHIGFSYHDTPQFFNELVDAYDWEFCQIQYNYLDVNFQAGHDGLQYAAAKDLGIIIMEPLRGGGLTNNLPEEIIAAFNESFEKKTPAEWAFRWLFDNEKVGMVLSGMSTMEQVVENVKTAASGVPNSLSGSDKAILHKVQEIFRERLKVRCTKCRYCMPCPAGVNIPENFNLYNAFYLTGADWHSRIMYVKTLSDKEKASSCVECGKCEELCPQGIKIIEELKNVVALFEAKPAD
jgi:hypothetical protein